MPRSQPPTVEKLTTDFLKLNKGEQQVVLGVFTAITKSVPRAHTLATMTTLGIEHSAKPAPVGTPKPKRTPKPAPAAEPAPVIDTE